LRLARKAATALAIGEWRPGHLTQFTFSGSPSTSTGCGCLLYERTGSLLPGIAVHSFVDANAIDLALSNNDLIVTAAFSTLGAVLVVRASVRRLVGRDRRAQRGEIPQTTH